MIEKSTAEHLEQHDQEHPIIYDGKMLGKKYIVRGEKPETMQEWKQQIEHVFTALQAGDINLLKMVMKNQKYIDYDHVQAILESGELDEKTKLKWAVSLWVLREQPDWQGFIPIGKKLFQRMDKYIGDIVGTDAVASCMDATILEKEMLKQFGMEDTQIKQKPGVEFIHHFLDAGDGVVLDTYWAQKTGGLVRRNKPEDVAIWRNPSMPQSRIHPCGPEST